ncbi:MAG: PepSY domain-containing protein, partial [Chloroflexota bacterium]|nr:PepSY domain-containing protein [Chloroflexota bacterium]
MTRNRWLMGAGGGTLILLGGIVAGPVASYAGDDPAATLSEEDAIAAAVAAFPGTSASDVAFEAEDGLAIYEVTLSNGLGVEIDGNSGAVLESEPTDGNDEQDDRDEDNEDNEDDGDVEDNDDGNGEQEDTVAAGTLDDGADLLPQA